MSEESDPLIDTATLAFVSPLIAYMLIGMFYPDFVASYDSDGEATIGVTRETWVYLGLVGLQVIVAATLVCRFYKIYLRAFPIRASWLSLPAGIIGVVLWIGLCQVGWEGQVLSSLGMDFNRPSFNPWTIADLPVRVLFLVLRFTLLAILVPIVEELFLRGWLVRYIENPDFESVSLNQLGLLALFSASLYGVLTHPSEAIAAFCWFGMVTLLVRHTGNLWDAVIAHALTNLLLGIYVIYFQQWQLW
jgi:CAAX prenyl protease-like protein